MVRSVKFSEAYGRSLNAALEGQRVQGASTAWDAPCWPFGARSKQYLLALHLDTASIHSARIGAPIAGYRKGLPPKEGVEQTNGRCQNSARAVAMMQGLLMLLVALEARRSVSTRQLSRSSEGHTERKEASA